MSMKTHAYADTDECMCNYTLSSMWKTNKKVVCECLFACTSTLKITDAGHFKLASLVLEVKR